jgi:YD repeat-containing protein
MPNDPGFWALQTVTFPDTKAVTYQYQDTNPINRFALTGIVDENGHTYETTAYDSVTGRVTSTERSTSVDQVSISYDDVHSTRTVTNALGKQAVYNFATFEGTLQLSSVDGQASTNCPAATVSYSYDSNGFTSQTTSGESRVNTYVHNSIGQETSRTEGYGSGVARTITTNWNFIGASSQATSYAYDKDNNQVSVTDPRSKVYGFAFDALNRLYQQTDPDSYQTTSSLNAQDDALSVTDARFLTTTYVRDGFGDAIRQTSPDTGITDFWYDANGAVTKQVDARTIETDFTNDNLGRVLTKTFPASSGENVAYTYDSTASGNKGVGYLTSLTDQSGSKAFVIDALGHTSSETDVIGTNTYVAGYTYDAAGHILTETYPSGRIVS